MRQPNDWGIHELGKSACMRQPAPSKFRVRDIKGLLSSFCMEPNPDIVNLDPMTFPSYRRKQSRSDDAYAKEKRYIANTIAK